LNINNKKILFSGDIGRSMQSVIKSYNTYNFSNYSPDYIIMEALYGNRIHEGKDDDILKIAETIKQIKEKNSKIIMPIFALHRTQELLEILNYFSISGKLDMDCRIFLDTPMGIEITKVYLDNLNLFNNREKILNDEISFVNNNNDNDEHSDYKINQNERFAPRNLSQILKNSKSKKLINAKNAIILAGSGMADGGRVIKHLYSGLEDPDNYVVFVGFQAEDTLGRKLVDEEKTVTIMEKKINVRAKILDLRGFSAHAYKNDIKNWLNKFDLKNLKMIFLTHGEDQVKKDFIQELKNDGKNAYIPKTLEEFEF
jgi:metallo-beta-lactamase family protein